MEFLLGVKLKNRLKLGQFDPVCLPWAQWPRVFAASRDKASVVCFGSWEFCCYYDALQYHVIKLWICYCTLIDSPCSFFVSHLSHNMTGSGHARHDITDVLTFGQKALSVLRQHQNGCANISRNFYKVYFLFFKHSSADQFSGPVHI